MLEQNSRLYILYPKLGLVLKLSSKPYISIYEFDKKVVSFCGVGFNWVDIRGEVHY